MNGRRRSCSQAVLLAAACLWLMGRASARAETILVDFGPNDVTNGNSTPSPDTNGNYWNNLNATTVGSSISLVTVGNAATGFGLEVTTAFLSNGILNGGLLAPSASLLGIFAIATATQDFFFEGSGATPTFKLTGLNPTFTYNLRFFASRNWAGETRITRYTVTGVNGTFTADLTTSGNNIGHDGVYDGNDNRAASVNRVTPTAAGEIIVQLSALSGAYSYINAMEITSAEPIPTLTEWGMMALAALVVLAAAQGILRRRVAVPA